MAEFRGKPTRPKENLRLLRARGKRLGKLVVPGSPPRDPLTVVQQPNRTIPATGSGTELVNGRALLVGDAGHLVDPLFGQGIVHAVRSGVPGLDDPILVLLHDRRKVCWTTSWPIS